MGLANRRRPQARGGMPTARSVPKGRRLEIVMAFPGPGQGAPMQWFVRVMWRQHLVMMLQVTDQAAGQKLVDLIEGEQVRHAQSGALKHAVTP